MPTVIRSLGGVWPSAPMTDDGTSAGSATVAAAYFKKRRREKARSLPRGHVRCPPVLECGDSSPLSAWRFVGWHILKERGTRRRSSQALRLGLSDVLPRRSPLPQQPLQVLHAPGRLVHCTTFDAENNVSRAGAADLDHPGPVDHAVAAGAADRRAGHLAALGVGLLDRDVLGVQVDQPVLDVLEPGDGVLAAEVAVARVEVDADRRANRPGRRCDPARRWSCCTAGAAPGR